MPDEKKPRTPLNEGHRPVEKGWKPVVQGGYKPTSSQTESSPPKGGSGIKPTKK